MKDLNPLSLNTSVGVDGVVFVYDVGKRSTFEGIDKWVRLFNEKCDYTDTGMKAKAILVGNKCDISDEEREVPVTEGKMKAESLGMPFIETSAMLGTNIHELIERLASSIAADAPPKSPEQFLRMDEKHPEAGGHGRGCC
eukprot:gnl/Chilomastix_caulleri/2599.p1 GENE.gnl/Chilomastix_caulleri/2599~~gnl/Chilomastix_caulleri/2599.p1  ORF type:complete len:140 (+),score=45.19 gnl/Chilomastix_caulleri/2599:235-654(+)